MVEIAVSQDEARSFTDAVYRADSQRSPSVNVSIPLTKTPDKELDPTSLTSWISHEKNEGITDRQFSGLLTYICLTASQESAAQEDLFFDVEYHHTVGGEVSWPDIGLIKARFKLGHLAFASRDSRPVFYITPPGRFAYLSWRERFVANHAPTIRSQNFPNLAPLL